MADTDALFDVARHVAGGDQRILLVADHAANAVPAGIELGVAPEILFDHIAVDIGVGPLTEALSARLGTPAWLALYSRLVCDMNRPEDSPALAPHISDGIPVPGNHHLSPQAYAVRRAMHRCFHAGLGEVIVTQRPLLLVSVHSFTPALKSDPAAKRPWPVAVLWNRDDRAARLAIRLLEAVPKMNGPVGANEPYSGRILNYTMDRHAEANGIAYIGFEVRQDGISDPEGVAYWADILSRVILAVADRLGADAP